MAEPIAKEEINAATMIRFIASSMNGRVMVPAHSLFSHLFEQTLSHSCGFLALVAVAPILRPLHSGGNLTGGLVSFPILTAGAFARILGLATVLRLACRWFGCRCRRSRWRSGWGRCRLSSGAFSPTFCDIGLFRDLISLIGRLVCLPFLLAHFDCFLLSQRRRG